MKRRMGWALLGAAITGACGGGILGGCGGETIEQPVTAEERGALLFAGPSLGRDGGAVACADCHDEGGAVGATGKPGAPLGGVVDRPSTWGGQEDDLLDAVNLCLFWFMGRPDPLAADDPRGVDLFAHLASLEGDEAASQAQPFTIGAVVWPGAGDAARGAEVYDRSCRSCHGAIHTGEGALVATSPVLPEDTIAAHSPDVYDRDALRLVFVEKVRHGPFLGYGGTMPPFSVEVIEDAALADLLAHLEVP